MKLIPLRPIERALRRSRDKSFEWLRSFDQFRQVSLLTINADIVLVTKRFGDHTLTFSPHETIGKSLFKDGHYQRDLADRVLEIVGNPEGKTLLELGANIGTHSIYLTRAGLFDRLICVEPAPENIQLLKQNLMLNGLEDRATVVECAVGDRNGTVDFYFNETNFGASGLAKPDGEALPTQVQMRRVDDILVGAGARPGDIGLVWMDVEGAELGALKSMGDLIDRRVPILMEYIPRRYEQAEAEAMTSYLTSHYRRCIAFDGKSEREMPLRDVTEGTFDVLLLP